MRTWLQSIWYSRTITTQILRPLSWLFCCVVYIRKLLYRLHILRSVKLEVPVIIIGNLTVGGTGKTPLVIATVNLLKQKGYRPGIVSRGYGGRAKSWPQQVRPDSDPHMVGDEPIIIAKRTQCPMAVGPDRVSAAKALLKYADIDVIVSDDGLQHYALRRDIEVIVVDAIRRFGNGFCLPAGPLREPATRLQGADFVINNGPALNNEISMHYTGNTLINLLHPQQSRKLSDLRSEQIHAIAGIGNPDGFFAMLKKAELQIKPHVFPDHYMYQETDIPQDDNETVIMTEKDAVKCQRFASENMWYLPIEAILEEEYELSLLEKLGKCYG